MSNIKYIYIVMKPSLYVISDGNTHYYGKSDHAFLPCLSHSTVLKKYQCLTY